MDYRSLGKRPIEGSEYTESPSKKQSARDSHHLWLHPLPDLELRLGPPPAQLEKGNPTRPADLVTRDFSVQFCRTPDQIAERQVVQPQEQERESIILRQQPEVSQASSSRQQFGWQGQEAFHLAQPHQEIGPSSQPEVINEQMPPEISSDSDSESNHARPLFIRETSHARIHHQAGPSNQGEARSLHQAGPSNQGEARSLHQAGPSDHLRPRDQAEQGQTTLTEQFKQQRYEIYKQSQVLEKQYQAGSSNLGMHDSSIPLDQIPWYQITQRQRNIQLERTGDESRYRQTQGDSASLGSRPNRSLDELLIFAQAVRNQGHREKLPEHLLQSIRLMPFNHSEYKSIVNIYKAQGFKGDQLGDFRRRIYNMTEMGKKSGEKFREKKASQKANQLNRPLEAKDSEAKRDPSNSADGSGADETIA